MSSQAVKDVLARSVLDADFQRSVLIQPDAALAAFDLTEAERAAIVSGDYPRISMAEQGLIGVEDEEAARRMLRHAAITIAPVNQVTVQTVQVVQATSFNIVNNLSVTPIIVVSTANTVAMSPDLEEAKINELRRRGEAVQQMEGDRIDAIKEMLALMR
jgi:hypothetical protein